MERHKEYSRIVPINELYTAVQCEGSRLGRPCVMIRFSGCSHRCHFGEGGWCDSWQSSIHPEKGQYKFHDIVKLYDDNPQIRDMVITGGSPTMFPKYVNELLYIAKERNIFVTIETEGSHFIETDYQIDLLSISPKFSNSVPKIGITTPMGKIVDKKFIDQHNKFRLNKTAISQMVAYHKDYHYKPVWDGNLDVLEEIEKFRIEMGFQLDKTYLMPAGDNRDTLIEMYPMVIDMCIRMGYNFTPRPHIIAFDRKRKV